MAVVNDKLNTFHGPSSTKIRNMKQELCWKNILLRTSYLDKSIAVSYQLGLHISDPEQSLSR